MTDPRTPKEIALKLRYYADYDRGRIDFDSVMTPSSLLKDAATLIEALAAERTARENVLPRDWTGTAQVNFSNDAWVKVWQDGEWTIIHARAGGSETTVSLRDHQAWDVAFALTPELATRFERARTAENALREFQQPSANPDELRQAADEVDCGPDCDHDSRTCFEQRVCKHIVAEDMRNFAVALERRAALPTEKRGEDD